MGQVRETLHPWTHLSLADVTTLLADNAVNNGPMVQPMDKCTTTGAHKRVLQRTEQNPVQLLYIMLICSLTEDNRKRIKLGTERYPLGPSSIYYV